MKVLRLVGRVCKLRNETSSSVRTHRTDLEQLAYSSRWAGCSSFIRLSRQNCNEKIYSMSLNRWSTRRDASEPEILRALATVGADYILLDAFDVLALFRGQVFLLDCKTAKGRRTRNQTVLVERGWPLKFVRTPEEALRAIGALRTESTSPHPQSAASAAHDSAGRSATPIRASSSADHTSTSADWTSSRPTSSRAGS